MRFNRRLLQLQKLQVQGQQAYASNQEARIAFNNVQPVGKIMGGFSYALGVLLAVDVSIQDSGAAGTLNENQSFNVIDQIDFNLPWEPRPIVKLTDGGAGAAIHAWERISNGRRGHGSGNIPVTGGGSTDTYRLKIFIPFGPNLSRSEFWYPISLLRNGNMRIKWAATGSRFGATVTINSATQIREALLVTVERNEFVVPPPITLETFEVPGTNESLPLAGRIPHCIAEIPVHADGLADNVITNSERTTITFQYDGHRYCNALQMEELIELFNQYHVTTRDERLPDGEADTCPVLPIFTPDRPDYSLTYLPMFEGDPRLEVAGSDTSPRLVMWHQGMNDRDRIQRAARIAGHSFSGAFYKDKVGRDQPLGGLSGTRLPVLLK